MRAAPVLSLCVSVAVVLLLLVSCGMELVSGQSYVPQAPPFSGCPLGQQVVTVGYLNSSDSTVFPYDDEYSTLWSWRQSAYQYVYVTPFTLRGSQSFGTVLYQLQMSLMDNSALLQPAHFRLVVYLFQEAERRVMSFNEASLLGQTDEITLYPSRDQIIYANLLQPVLLDSEGDYGIGIFSDSTLYIAGGLTGSGFSGLSEFYRMSGNNGYNDYSAPEGVLLYAGDRVRPVGGQGCLNASVFNQTNQAVYAFCALVETYIRQPANNTSPLVSSLTNVTRYSGVIAVDNTTLVNTSYGRGNPIVFMEGDVQITTNAGAFDYPPLGMHVLPFTYSQTHDDFKTASDVLYPQATIPIDRDGIVITTKRNRTLLFMTNVSKDSTIGQRGDNLQTIQTFFSSFTVEPKAELDDVITVCNVPPGHDYVPDALTCEPSSAFVTFGDIDLDDLDPLEYDEASDFLKPNLMSFRFFIAWTPDTTAYQLTYFTYSNPEAIVHMRMGLFATNTTYVDSFSALPQYQLLSMTDEIELVNVADTLISANLTTPVKLVQNSTYAIGVWSDTLLYGPQARWGNNAAGLPLPYNSVTQDGVFPAQVYALGGQTGVQPMGVNACAARQSIVTYQWCATFGDYVNIFGQWYIDRRYYSGTLHGLSTHYSNDWGTYIILTAGNGTFFETLTPVDPPPPPFGWSAQGRHRLTSSAYPRNRTGTWNLNNFQVQSPDFLYLHSASGQLFDTAGMQFIINYQTEWYTEVWAVIINSVKPRGSAEWFYQEAYEDDYRDQYIPLFNSATEMKLVPGSDQALPWCGLDFVAWDLVYPYNSPFVAACTGLANIQSTYGDNRVFDYAQDQEGHVLAAGVVYTINFTATAGTTIWQVSLDVLNNTHLLKWVSANIGIYNSSGVLLTNTSIWFLEALDEMIVVNLYDGDRPGLNITSSGLYYVAVVLSHDYHVATGSIVGPSMKVPVGHGLPAVFVADGVSAVPPLTAYGCVPASHYFCGSFQYYIGDNYSPVAVDYLYQGLLLQPPDVQPQHNDYGDWVPILYGVGHVTTFARIARYAANFLTSYTDILLSNPGNNASNYIYVSSNNGASLDSVGLAFLTDDDFGPKFSITYNVTSELYQDSTDAQLGSELLNSFVIKSIDRTVVGVPQCSFLDLEQVVEPASSLSNSTSCGSDSHPVMWGDAAADDEFYTTEGLFANDFTIITLSPFNTGPEWSAISQLAIALHQNANVFSHIRLALYDLEDALLAESNEVTVDNPQDMVLYFTLNTTVLLQPASTYYIAFWTDVSLFTAAGADYTALCYYGAQYGYDLQPWPASVGSKEAEYVPCRPLPVAALGCVSKGGTPTPPPECPQGSTHSGVSAAAVAAIVLIAVALTVVVMLVAFRLYLQGKCKRGASSDGGSALLSGDSSTSGSKAFAALED